MIKILLMLIVASLIYIGINWEQISEKIDSGMDAVEQVKAQADDVRDDFESNLEDAQSKLEDAKDKVEDHVQ